MGGDWCGDDGRGRVPDVGAVTGSEDLRAASKRLETIPGVGFITATAIAATVTDPTHFKSSRQFAAWLGLTPKQNSSGGKERLGGISKMGDRYLRTLLVVGATSVMRYARDKGAVSAIWINKLLAKKVSLRRRPPCGNEAAYADCPYGRPYRQSSCSPSGSG
jgi:transposase